MASKPFYHAIRPGGKHGKPARLSQAEWDRRTNLQAKAIERSGRQLWHDRRGRPVSVGRPPISEIDSKKAYSEWVSETIDIGRTVSPSPKYIRIKYTVLLDGHSFVRHYPWNSLSGLDSAGKSSGWPSAEETGDWRKQIGRQLEAEGAFDGPSPTSGDGRTTEPDVALDEEAEEFLSDMSTRIGSEPVESGEPVRIEAWWIK